jgi:hypothetical protein
MEARPGRGDVSRRHQHLFSRKDFPMSVGKSTKGGTKGVKKTTKSAAKKTATKKSAPKKAAGAKSATKKTATKKAATKKAGTKKATTKKASPKS